MKTKDVIFIAAMAAILGGLVGAQVERMNAPEEIRKSRGELAQLRLLRDELAEIYHRHKADPPKKLLGVTFTTGTGAYQLECDDSGRASACRLTASGAPKSP